MYDRLFAESIKNTRPLQAIFASVSDIHMNYAQGKVLWLHVLDVLQQEQIPYIIISGDIGETAEDFAIYEDACLSSPYQGLIFSCVGNHEQGVRTRTAFRNHAIYDGAAKRFLSLPEAGSYFQNSYRGPLSVQILYQDLEGAGDTLYFAATIDGNLFVFMDQMLSTSGGTKRQDNFTSLQMDFVESVFRTHKSTHRLFVAEHAPVTQLKVGHDPYIRYYGNCIVLDPSFPNNLRFKKLLNDYPEAVWMSGHTHLSFDLAICYADREYDADGNLTSIPIAHCIHNSSTAQTREVIDGKIAYGTDFRSASQGYVCYQTQDAILFEARIFKPRTTNPELEPETLTNQVYPKASICFRF